MNFKLPNNMNKKQRKVIAAIEKLNQPEITDAQKKLVDLEIAQLMSAGKHSFQQVNNGAKGKAKPLVKSPYASRL